MHSALKHLVKERAREETKILLHSPKKSKYENKMRAKQISPPATGQSKTDRNDRQLLGIDKLILFITPANAAPVLHFLRSL